MPHVRPVSYTHLDVYKRQVIRALEADEQVRVVVFDSAVDDSFLNHSDFQAKLEDLTGMPAGPTGLPPWPDFLARLTRLPVASIALIRGRATGNGRDVYKRQGLASTAITNYRSIFWVPDFACAKTFRHVRLLSDSGLSLIHI